MTYYERTVTTHIDGSPIFKTEEDEKNEEEISKLVGEALNCNLRSFGRLSVIDWYAERDGRLVGIVELKSRTHKSTDFGTVFLNVRKWLALLLGSTGLGVPAIFVVRFTDCVKWINVSEISTKKIAIRGCKGIVKSRNDVEPIIEVPVAQMKDIKRS